MPRVLIVEDSGLMRRILCSVVEAIDGFEVADVAASAEEAERKLAVLHPDAILLDVHLPGMDGLTFLDRLAKRRATAAIVISSRGLGEILRSRDELADLRFEFVEKPDGVTSTLDDFRRELAARLTTLVGRRSRPGGRLPDTSKRFDIGLRDIRLIAIGTSTGGVDAVTNILASLSGTLPPILIAMHMPAAYTGRFARRLGALTGQAVEEAREGETLEPGQVRLAPGGQNLTVESRHGVPRTRLTDDPSTSGHRPSIDALFSSVASAFSAAAVGVILTGMGRDGAQGLLAMRKAGAATFGQAGAGCTIYGMPKAAAELGAVEHEVPLGSLGQELMRTLATR
jgi:two-component system chemotaxis response regulator CheB